MAGSRELRVRTENAGGGRCGVYGRAGQRGGRRRKLDGHVTDPRPR